MSAPPIAQPDRRVIAVFLAIIVLGGSNAVAIRIGGVELPPFWGAALRFGLAALLLVPVVAILRPRRPTRRHLLGAVVYGLMNFGVSYAFVYLGLVDAPAGVAQVTIALAPLFTLFLAVLHRIERLSWAGVGGALVAAVGIAIVFGERLAGDVPLGSLVALLLGSIAIAEATVLVKVLPPGHPVWANLVGMAVGAALLAVISIGAGERWALPTTTDTWLSVLYLAIVGSIGLFLAFLYVIARWTASATSYVLLLMPLWTIVVGAILLDEPITAAFLAGAALTLLGTYVGIFGRRGLTRLQRRHAPA